jgi:hypothetical protein
MAQFKGLFEPIVIMCNISDIQFSDLAWNRQYFKRLSEILKRPQFRDYPYILPNPHNPFIIPSFIIFSVDKSVKETTKKNNQS